MPTKLASRIIGVLLAAGRGRRMGGAKQFHSLPTSDGTKPLVAASYDAVQEICEEMIVVLGHRAQEVADLLVGRSFHRIASDPDAPMFDSIRAGLQAAHELDPAATILLQPADHPDIAPATLDLLIAASQENSTLAVLPLHQGQGGHPVLIPPSVTKLILAAECPEGLRQFWIDHPDLCNRIEVNDPSAIRDIDNFPE